MTRNGDIRSLSGTEGIWRAGVKWEARDASARLEPLGMFFYYCIFLTILTSLLKVLCLQMMTSRVTGREGRWEWGGSRYVASRAPAFIFFLKRLSTIVSYLLFLLSYTFFVSYTFFCFCTLDLLILVIFAFEHFSRSYL